MQADGKWNIKKRQGIFLFESTCHRHYSLQSQADPVNAINYSDFIIYMYALRNWTHLLHINLVSVQLIHR